VTANKLAQLEGGFGAHITSSGMAAVTTSLFTFLKSGDHVISKRDVYGGTYEVMKDLLPKFGIEVTFVNDEVEVEKAIKENTKVIYVETPANPTLAITDLEMIAKIANSRNIITIVDSTFATPVNQNPLQFGFDIVIHSCTKYLGGHSDLTAGCIISKTQEIHEQIFQSIKLFGCNLSPFDSYLLHRGIKTLDVRMERHNNNAMKIAKFLESHNRVERVYYPGLPSHPSHEKAKKQMRGFGGMIAFEVKGGVEGGRTVLENVKLIHLAVSLGGVESLIEQASTMTHTMVSREDRLKGGITDGLIRLSVGIEDVEDLIEDLDQALNKI
jgi:methionine-gamma-lyase